MKLYEDIESERERIEKCVSRFGWTSDHNLDWFSKCAVNESGKPMFVEFDDGSGLLVHKYPAEWRIWSDPLSAKNSAADKITEFAISVLDDQIEKVWCVDASDTIYPMIRRAKALKLNEIYYFLFWPVLDMEKHNPTLPGGRFKDIRNAKNKFYREHEVWISNAAEVKKDSLHRIIDDWKETVSKKQASEDIEDLKYHKAIEDGFKGFITARVIIVDGRPLGINAGYEVPNTPGRFAGIVGIHNYFLNDLGLILWLEDLEWIKNADYKVLDMQGSEDDGGLKLKLRFGAKIERKTDTFSIQRS